MFSAKTFLPTGDKIVQQRLTSVIDKWNPQHPDCVFKHYFYNKVDEAIIPFFHPGPNDNPKEWEEALQNKPAPGMMPVLASGFTAIADRLKTQRNVISIYNQRLHEINNCLDAILSKHDLDWSVKMIEARRKHEVLRRRTLVIARKVQVLRNRGYALSGDEDELRQKLESMERAVQDPAVNARLDELWSRLIFLREQAQFLKDELAKKGLSEDSGLDGEVEAKVKKVSLKQTRGNSYLIVNSFLLTYSRDTQIVEDYEKQLQHLRKECELIKKDFDDYEKSHPSLKAKQAI